MMSSVLAYQIMVSPLVVLQSEWASETPPGVFPFCGLGMVWFLGVGGVGLVLVEVYLHM